MPDAPIEPASSHARPLRTGLLAGGNWVVDHIKLIDTWPQQDALATVLSHTLGSGGAPYNVLKDLAHLGAPFPLAAAGLLGDDAAGRAILDDCRRENIGIEQLHTTTDTVTSYTDVMTVKTTGRRTFFYHKGANAHLALEHFDFSRTQARHFHLGYLLLLDRLDRLEEGVPASATLLQRARKAGLSTSVDCVSDSNDRFATLVRPVLPWVDVFFANDYEAGKIAGVELRTQGRINRQATEAAAKGFLTDGVRGWVVIHFPEAVFALSSENEALWQPSVKIHETEIINAAGAGDALAAGILYGWHEGWALASALELGVAAAAASLLHITCTEGVPPMREALDFARSRGFISPPL